MESQFQRVENLTFSSFQESEEIFPKIQNGSLGDGLLYHHFSGEQGTSSGKDAFPLDCWASPGLRAMGRDVKTKPNTRQCLCVKWQVSAVPEEQARERSL